MKIDVTPGEAAALDADDFALFMMQVALAGHEMCLDLIDEIARAQAWNVLFTLVRDGKSIAHYVGWDRFVIYCCSSSMIPNVRAQKLLMIAEENKPGVVAQSRDGIGNNAYACTFLRKGCGRIVISDPTTWRWPTVPELRKFLAELGCDEATPVHHLNMV